MSVELSVSPRQLAAIELPLLVRNSAAAVRMLGGDQRLAESLANKKQRLRLQLTPDNLLSPPILGDPQPARAALVLRVRRQRHAATGRRRLVVECVGVAGATYEFRSLADFQYLPVVREPDGSWRDIYDDLVPRRPQHLPEAWLLRQVPLHTAPALMSRQETVADYRLAEAAAAAEAPTPSGDEGSGSGVFGRKPRSGLTASASMSTLAEAGPPLCPTPALEAFMRSVRDDQRHSLLARLDALLLQFPVVSLAFLHSRMPELESGSRRHFIKARAFRMFRGPWHNLWIRFGYNPLLHSESRHYQTVDIRLHWVQGMRRKRQVSLYNRQVSLYNREVSPYNRQVSQQQQQQQEAGFDFELLPDRVPEARQVPLQLCHIKVENIRKRVESLQPQSSCSHATGWFSEEDISGIRQMVYQHIRSLRPAPLGAAAAPAASEASAAGTAAAKVGIDAGETPETSSSESSDAEDLQRQQQQQLLQQEAEDGRLAADLLALGAELAPADDSEDLLLRLTAAK